MDTYLRKRKMFDLSFRDLAFYSLFETGEFLLAPYKVVWKEIASEVACAVQGPHKTELLSNRTVIPDHKLVIIPCDEEKEAHYLCASLNSAPARFVAGTYIVGTQISTHVLEYIKLPRFDPHSALHTDLAKLSEQCHAAAVSGDSRKLDSLESDVDETAAKLWSIPKDGLKTIQGALAETTRNAESEEGDDA